MGHVPGPGLEQGHLPQADSRLLTHAILGLNTSVWHWYRPGGPTSLTTISDFFVRRQLAILGLTASQTDQMMTN
ncbi:hypothetical protein [Acrocarpospora catenulata]|uniref:hypothetical protein n=1 Tax=Acrocarpospora catenulata TaxID=2836182 RepID=UPI003555E8E5